MDIFSPLDAPRGSDVPPARDQLLVAGLNLEAELLRQRVKQAEALSEELIKDHETVQRDAAAQVRAAEERAAEARLEATSATERAEAERKRADGWKRILCNTHALKDADVRWRERSLSWQLERAALVVELSALRERADQLAQTVAELEADAERADRDAAKRLIAAEAAAAAERSQRQAESHEALRVQQRLLRQLDAARREASWLVAMYTACSSPRAQEPFGDSPPQAQAEAAAGGAAAAAVRQQPPLTRVLTVAGRGGSPSVAQQFRRFTSNLSPCSKRLPFSPWLQHLISAAVLVAIALHALDCWTAAVAAAAAAAAVTDGGCGGSG